MEHSHHIFGEQSNYSLIKSAVASAKSGNGAIIGVVAESGYGKTNLLQYLHNDCTKDVDVISVYHESQAPIGNFNVSTLQPLQPFAKIMEFLLENKFLSPERRLAKNLSLTALSTIPIVGDVFYAVKEIGRDWRQFKKDKSEDETTKKSSIIGDYYDSLSSYADKKPLILIFDDFHWSDAQSIELMNLFAESIHKMPLLITFSYKPSILDTQALPLSNLISKKNVASHKIKFITLEKLSKEHINQAARTYIRNYRHNEEFEEWIYKKSYGVQGIVIEYIKYFAKYSPFNPDGTLATNFEDNEFLPASLQALLTQQLEAVTEEDRTILSICAAEGRKFTATIVSSLLNEDVLTTIKKLRAIQNKTDIIRSLGAQYRYGEKTTTYVFTQAIYQTYFENSLEYEEYKALHSHIAAILKQQYEAAVNEEIKRQIAPFLAAHSSESGDKETAESVLMLAAKAAQEHGIRNFGATSPQVEDYDEGEFEGEIPHKGFDSSRQMLGNGAAEAVSTQEPDNFESARANAVNLYINGSYMQAADIANKFFEKAESLLNVTDKVQLLTIAARSLIELGDFSSAEDRLSKAMAFVDEHKDTQALCFIYNTYAILNYEQEHYSQAYRYIDMAAKLAVNLPPELRLVTLTNISLVMKQYSMPRARKFYDAAEKLAELLNFRDFHSDLRAIRDDA